MAKRKKRDFTQVALGVVEKLTGGKLTGGDLPAEPPDSARSLGSSKAGKARAAKLSAKRRKEIARKAAETRWKKRG